MRVMTVQIGDLIREEQPSEEVAIVVAIASTASDGITADDFFLRKKFDGPGQRQFSGLAGLIEHFPTSFSYGTDFGVESVAVPFSHVYFLCNRNPGRAERLAVELAQKIERRWKAAIDPIVGARISFLEFSNALLDPLKVFFGAGIFIPPPNEQPVGTLEIEPLGRGIIQEPTLGETRRPAGLYRAQSALVFASMPGLAPAAVDLALAHPFMFFLAPGRSSLPPQRPLHAINLQHDGSHPGYKIRRNEPELEPDGDDIADEFVVSFEDNNAFLLRYRADIRPSRLRRCPRPGRLAITGVIEPRTNGKPVSHWWVDLDSDGIMIGSALASKARSVAVFKGNVHSYNWRAFARDRRSARDCRVERAPVQGGPAPHLHILRKLGAKPFGYLQRPSEPSWVSYRATPDKAESYSLDWLEFAVGVEMAFQREALTALSQLTEGADIMLGPADANWAVRAPNGVLYRELGAAKFRRVEEAPWRPGGELVLDPLVLTMLGDR